MKGSYNVTKDLLEMNAAIQNADRYKALDKRWASNPPRRINRPGFNWTEIRNRIVTTNLNRSKS